MATVDDILTEIYRRTRDPDRVATPEALGIQLLSEAQNAVNLAVKSQVSNTTITLNSHRLLYKISEMVLNIPCARLEAVRIKVNPDFAEISKDLVEVPWQDLWRIDLHWFRTVGEPKHWAKIGRDLFVIYPGPTEDRLAAVAFTHFIGPLTALDEDISLRTEFFPLLLDLTEALFLLRLRLVGAASSALSKSSEPFDIVMARLKGAVGIK